MAKSKYTKRPDGRYSTSVTIDGKRNFFYAYTIADLENQILEFKTSNLTTTKDVIFKDYAEKWLELNSSAKAPATIKEYNYIVKKYLIPNFGYIKLKNIKRIHIQNMQKDLLENNHIELSHKCIRFMKTICDDAIANDCLNKNPCFGIKEPKLVHKEKEILTKEQDELLLNSNHKYAPFFRILRYTGMRREEITALTPLDIDLKGKNIIINKAVSFVSNQPVLKETKNKKSRTVPILDVIYNDLKERIEYCEKNNTKYLFTQPNHIQKMLSQESIRCMTKQMCKELEFTFTPHQLRHSYCTMLYYSGITIKQTQNLMGHSSAKMVYDLYAHLDEKREDLSNKINVFLSNEVKSEVKVET